MDWFIYIERSVYNDGFAVKTSFLMSVAGTIGYTGILPYLDDSASPSTAHVGTFPGKRLLKEEVQGEHLSLIIISRLRYMLSVQFDLIQFTSFHHMYCSVIHHETNIQDYTSI